jgi:hypothetical protein
MLMSVVRKVTRCNVILQRGNLHKNCSKWAGVCTYNIPELLFVAEFHTGIHQCIQYSFSFSIFLKVYPCFDFKKNSTTSKLSFCALHIRAFEVRSPAEAKDFSFSLSVQTGYGAHTASCTMGTGGLISGAKSRLGRDADH